jgi:hypothetical protein
MFYVFLGLSLVFVSFVAYSIFKKENHQESDEVLKEDQDSDVFSLTFSSEVAPETTVTIPEIMETPVPVEAPVEEKPVVKKKAIAKKTTTPKQKPNA